MDKKGRTRVIALLSSLCGASFIALMCSIFAWFIPNNQLDNTHISGSLLRGYFHEANFGTEAKPIYSDGSEKYPYVITRPQHLYNLAHLQYEYVAVGNDEISFADQGYHFQIGWDLYKDDKKELEVYDLSGQIKQDSKVLDMGGMILPPIGFVDQNATGTTASDGDYSFKGSFNGNGFNICNFTVEGSFTSGGRTYYPKNIGFFGEIAKPSFDISGNNDQVTNFTLKDVTINTHTGRENVSANEKVNYVGYACGYVNEGKLSKVGVYKCTINCSASYFRSNYTLIGEKNVANSSLAENAPILDYAFDPHGVVSKVKWWDTSMTGTDTKTVGTTCYSLNGSDFYNFVFPDSGYNICGAGKSLNDNLYYNYSYDENKNVLRKKYSEFTDSDSVKGLLYDPRVFDIYGAGKMSNYTVKSNFSTLKNTTIVTGYSNDGYATTQSNGSPTDVNGNPIEIKFTYDPKDNNNNKYGAIQLDGDASTSLERKVVFKCDGKGKFLLIIIPNSDNITNGQLFVYNKSVTALNKIYTINLGEAKKGVPKAIEIPIEGKGEYAYSTNFMQRIVYLRFIMQSEFGNTGGSGSVESVDYTYSTLEIPGSTGFTLSRITIRFDSPFSKDVIIVVTRVKSNTSDEIKISSDSKYVIGGTNKNFTIINKVPAGSKITINYPPSG